MAKNPTTTHSNRYCRWTQATADAKLQSAASEKRVAAAAAAERERETVAKADELKARTAKAAAAEVLPLCCSRGVT